MKYLLVTVSLFSVGAKAATVDTADITHKGWALPVVIQQMDDRTESNRLEIGDNRVELRAHQQHLNNLDAVYLDHDNRIVALENQPKPTNGVDGKDGSNGVDGQNGKDGATGAQGLKGDTGAQGIAGRDGIDGHDGITTLRTFHSVDTATQSMVSHDSLRIDALERQQKATDRKIDQNHKEAMHGVASAMAMTGLHYTNDDNSIAIGAGEYASSGAAAMGYRHQFSSHMATAIQASWDGENSGVAGSVAVGW